MLVQVVISGILSGALYAMVALGLALIFGVMRIINVAHGPLLMLGAYATYFLSTALGINPYLTVPVSMAMLFVVGVLLERTLVFRVVDAPELSSLLLTFGVSIALVNLAQLLFTSDLRSVEYLTGAWVVGPFALSKSRVVAFVFAGALTGLAFLFLGWTRLGKAIRATSQSREVAMVCGIDVQRIHLVTFGLAAALAAALALAAYPVVASGYGVRATLQIFMWIVLAGSWNLISGLTGYVSFGHVAFFGAGAYAGAILISKAGWPWLAAALVGGGAAVLLALVIGYPCLRLKGTYFAIAMLGLNEVLRALVSYFEGLTGGGNGLSLPTLDATVPIYYVMGLTAVAVTVLTYLIITSRFGLRLMTIREDEVAAEAMGIDTARHKLYAFLLSAVGPGIVGALTARDQGYIEPISVFPLATTITMIVMVLLGGKGTVWGPVLGAVVLFVAQEVVWARYPYVHPLLFGAIIVAVVLLMPRGVLGILQIRYRLPRTI